MSTLELTQQEIQPVQASRRTYLLLALILPIFAVAPLLYPGYIQTHSGFVLLWNVADLRTHLGDWGWLPHVALRFDPLRSDGLLPYYLAALLPLPPVVAVKVVLGLGWLLGSAGVFWWLKGWLGPPGALIAALVYTYLPYQIAAVYVRGVWGETFFGGILPWALLATVSLAKNLPVRRPSVHRFSLSPAQMRGLPLAGWLAGLCFWVSLGLSQLGLTLWAFILVVALVLVVYPGRAVLLLPLLGIGLVGSVYLFLAPPTAAWPVHLTDHFLYPFQLFSAYWGFGPSRPGWDDGLSFQVGLAAFGLAILSLVLWQGRSLPNARPGRTGRRLLFFLLAAIFLTLLQFKPAIFLWNIPLGPGYTLASTLTYPWQLLGLIGLCLAALAGAACRLDEQLTHLPLFSSIIILVTLSSYPYLSPQFIPLDQPIEAGPEAELGAAQLALVAHDFSVLTSGNTAGLERGQTRLPLAVHGPLQADEVLLLTVTWQPLQTFNEDLKIFVHLVDANDDVLAQYDAPPRAGDYPTSRWIPGELIADSYPLLIPAGAPPGPYRVFLGLYQESTLARLPVLGDPEGRVILDVQ